MLEESSIGEEHRHTDHPPQESPWCEICNYLLTWESIHDEEGKEPPYDPQRLCPLPTTGVRHDYGY